MTDKIQQLASRLPAHTAALVQAPHHLRYLTGFLSGDSYLFITAEAAYFLTDFRYIEQAEKTVLGAECRMITSVITELKALVKKHDIAAVITEDSYITAAEKARYARELPVENGELDAWLGELRIVKSEAELQKIAQAQAVTEEAFRHILDTLHTGMTERAVALELEFYMRRHGAERVAFDIIAVSGANGSLPHGIPSDKVIQNGELLTMDFGAVVDGYHSDMTRTVAFGRIDEEQRAVYETVLAAQAASLAVLREGVSCVEGDAAARRIIEQAGYGDCFGHGTGHGVGLEIHEAPRLSPLAGETVLRAGNVVTVEPGIYVAGRFGVRIEDMVLITKDGYRNFTAAPKELLVLS